MGGGPKVGTYLGRCLNIKFTWKPPLFFFFLFISWTILVVSMSWSSSSSPNPGNPDNILDLKYQNIMQIKHNHPFFLRLIFTCFGRIRIHNITGVYIFHFNPPPGGGNGPGKKKDEISSWRKGVKKKRRKGKGDKKKKKKKKKGEKNWKRRRGEKEIGNKGGEKEGGGIREGEVEEKNLVWGKIR